MTADGCDLTNVIPGRVHVQLWNLRLNASQEGGRDQRESREKLLPVFHAVSIAPPETRCRDFNPTVLPVRSQC